MEFATALSAIALIAKGAADVNLPSLGISEEDLELTSGARSWLGQERHIVVKTLDALASGGLDSLGIPKFELPAEYYAGVILTVVDPVNFQAACSWVNCTRTAEAIASGGGCDPVTVARLFSMVCQLNSHSSSTVVRQRFRAKFLIALKNAGPAEGGAS